MNVVRSVDLEDLLLIFIQSSDFLRIEYSKRFEIFTLVRRRQVFISTLLSSFEI